LDGPTEPEAPRISAAGAQCTGPKTAGTGDAGPYHGRMDIDPDTAWKALATHDARYDGRLFIGVT